MGDTLSLEPTIYVGDMLSAKGAASHVIQYVVRGLPPDETAIVSEIHGRWRILRNKGDWTGDYDTPQEALAALGDAIRPPDRTRQRFDSQMV